ncbi:MAG TPA: universal stress protein [Nocardioides sp.]|nr:universal stress protein [Nocardioides sp.]
MTAPTLEPGYAVVAVDGTEEGNAAVSLAAEEAARLGLVLRLVHVMPPDIPLRPLLVPDTRGLGSYGSETLASAARLATDVAPDLEVTTHLTMGGRVSEVVDEAQDATFVVVGRRRATALDRAWSGGTLDGIASRATCPVVMVPSTRDRADRPRRVVAGFKSSEHSAELFEAAFRAADELGAELEIVHAWKLSSGYDDMIARRVSEAATNREQKQSIRDLIAPWQEGYPDVTVRVHVVHEYPVRALVEASREADRLILVKPLHGSLLHHLGRTARGVLRFAECPVVVVPAKPRDQLTMPPLELEEEGELVP